jgi:hypothetical protein
VSQSWKARVSAYEELQSAWKRDSSNNALTLTPDMAKKMVLDSNLAAQENALSALREYFNHLDREWTPASVQKWV